jgi:hypothetical protein
MEDKFKELKSKRIGITKVVFKVGEEVFAVSKADSEHGELGIYKCTVDAVNIELSGDGIRVDYWLKSPSGIPWGDSVEDKFVAENRDLLYPIVNEIWDKNS